MIKKGLFAAVCVLALGCSSNKDNNEKDSEPGENGTDSTGDTADGTGGETDPDAGGDADSDSDSDSDSDTDMDACESTSATAEMETVYLAFAFDVSGSMGEGDYDWHDKSLKWDPITAATRAFLEDSASLGMWASMTFFPAGRDRCEAESYLTPDVSMTALPSDSFGTAMDDYIEQDAWRGGTPTLHVINGTLAFIENSIEAAPGKYVIVLVTDGYPQGCDSEDNEISSVAAAAAAGAEDGVPIYVIGVNNPDIAGAPDTVSNLGQIAAAGGTGDAFIIDTGDPEQTSDDFKAVIDEIRGAALSCTVDIPDPPDGRVFDKQKVRVTYTSGTDVTVLTYEASCAAENAWRYDNADSPTQILLCDAVCETIQSDPAAELEIEFACVDTVVF